MRARNPLLIVKEYLEPGESVQVRKNALSALAALGEPESLALLVDSALNDTDAQVRERAEMEIASLPAAEGAQAVQPLLDGLNEPKRRNDVYALLGRLRNRDVPFRFPRLGIATRLRLAKSLRNKVYPKRGFRFHFRTFKGMSFGMLIAWLMFLFYFGRMLKIPSGMELSAGSFGLCLALWIVTVPIVMIATPYSIPPRYHADITGAALLEMLVAGLASAVLAGLSVLIWIFGQDEEGSVSAFGAPMVVLCAVSLAAAAVRGGTMVAFGIFHRKWPNYLSQILVGGLCGLAVYDLVVIPYGNTGDTFLAVGWMWVFLAVFGLAGAYARIDSEADSRPVITSIGVRLAAGALASVAVLVGLISMLPVPESRISAGSISQLPREFALNNVPATIAFQVGTQVELKVDDSKYTADLKSLDPGGIVVGDVSPLSGGRFEARIAHNSKVTSSDFGALIPELTKLLSWPQLKARIKRTVPVGGPVLLNVAIDQPKPKPSPGK